MKRALLVLFLTGFVALAAEASDFSRYQISPKAVALLEKNTSNPERYEPTCLTLEACDDFSHHAKTYAFEGATAKVAFDRLISLKGPDLWRGKGNFELLYDTKSKTYFDRTQLALMPTFAVGQVYFANLSIGGILTVVASYVVTEIDRAKLRISLSYVKQNKSHGIQVITFKDTSEGFEVLHETRFKSDSWLRDTIFYRTYHIQFMTEFYRNFSKVMETNQPSAVLNEF